MGISRCRRVEEADLISDYTSGGHNSDDLQDVEVADLISGDLATVSVAMTSSVLRQAR